MSQRVLCVIAHPDDECYAFGGALALTASLGAETSVLCFTDGAAGTHRGTANSAKELGEMRRAEFEASCKVLNVAHSELLHYTDGKLDQQPIATLALEIVKRIRSFRPHVVLTFGADGAANTHADHTTISAATTAAFHWSGNPKRFVSEGELFQPLRLFHQTTDFFLPERHRPLPTPWTLKLDISPVFDKKIEALRAHTSQLPLMQTTIPLFEQQGRYELYSLQAASVPQPATQSTRLFEGIPAE